MLGVSFPRCAFPVETPEAYLGDFELKYDFQSIIVMTSAVLIIEDEVTLAKNIKRYLERSNFEVALTASGEEGLERIDVFQPDVILLDHPFTRCCKQ